MSDWNLENTAPYAQKPYLFYAAFADQEVINKLEEDLVIPPVLEIAAMPASHFRSGLAWEKLQEERPKLAEQIAESPLAVALHGQVAQHESLDYLRQALTLMSALLGHGAVAVYDPITLTWYGPAEWPSSDTFNPFDHVTVLSSPDSNGKRHLGTRGLRKFGRPDLTVRDVAEDDVAETQRLIDHLINFLATGGTLGEGEPTSHEGWQAIPGPLEGGAEDPDFHNFYQTLTVTRTEA